VGSAKVMATVLAFAFLVSLRADSEMVKVSVWPVFGSRFVLYA
jgi:hypothetical protein